MYFPDVEWTDLELEVTRDSFEIKVAGGGGIHVAAPTKGSPFEALLFPNHRYNVVVVRVDGISYVIPLFLGSSLFFWDHPLFSSSLTLVGCCRCGHFDSAIQEFYSTDLVNTYFTSVSPVVNRESFFTGKTAPRCAFGDEAKNGNPQLDPNSEVFTEILQKAGYRTGLFGRWYLCERLSSSFPPPFFFLFSLSYG